MRAKGPISARIVLNRGFDFKGFVLRHHYESGAKHRPFMYSVWFYLDLKGNTRIPTRAGSAGRRASEACQQGNRLQTQCVGAHGKVPRTFPPGKGWRDEPNNVEPGSVDLSFGYGAEEPPAFCPRTHAFMFCQSGSSSVANCLPPWCVSARPPASGASGIRRKITQPLTMMLKPIIARTIWTNERHFVLLSGD